MWRGNSEVNEDEGRGGGRGRGRSLGRGRGPGRGKRGATNRKVDDVCWEYERTGQCSRGMQCPYSHGESQAPANHEPPIPMRSRPQETPAQVVAKDTYNNWKRIIKRQPITNDIHTVALLWKGALDILNDEDREGKQKLPRDLDDDTLFGRDHVRALMDMRTHAGGSLTYLKLVRPFLEVITHQALLDCLSVDTFVGRIYNFISGSNGSRAMPFFRALLTNIVDAHNFDTSPSSQHTESLLITVPTCLRELLRREQRALFNDDLSDIVNSIENSVEITGMDGQSVACATIKTRITELRAMIARANGLLAADNDMIGIGVSTAAVMSTYPRHINIPQNRHNNDKLDVANIEIVPTEDEVRSNHADFLPSTDPDEPHYIMNQAARLLDTHFRLLRHDVFGELKTALGGLIVAVEEDPSLLRRSKLDLGDIRANIYTKAQVTHLSYGRRRGLECRITFAQPRELSKKSEKERCRWWDESKRLDEGILLCLLSFNGMKCTPFFMVVTDKRTGPKTEYNLVTNAHQANIVAKLATRRQEDLDKVIRLSSEKSQALLIEFPSIILDTITPILENLQNMQQLNRLPFRQWILPERVTDFQSSATLDVPPPLYARRPGFTFSLKEILKDQSGEDFRINPSVCSVNDKSLINKVESLTALDHGQCIALLAALVREFCQIQGPPGTGKSFLGVKLVKVLLDCEAAQLGPIIIVCYTNHALDQFLEHLLNSGVERIIRIGGQSKSEALMGKNLRIVSKSESKTKSESYLSGSNIRSLEDRENTIKTLLWRLQGTKGRPDWKIIGDYLEIFHPRICRQFDRVDEDGFKLVGGAEPFDLWLERGTLTPDTPAEQTTDTTDELLHRADEDVNGLSATERLQLANHWNEALRAITVDNLHEEMEESDRLRQANQSIYDEVDRRVLEHAEIIGVTTTGLARKISTLQHVNAKVIICEEAGEVLEAHMLSTLLPTVEHVVCIGDHEQLRPTINNFKDLSLESSRGLQYQLDRSQFERLSVGQQGRYRLPIAQLNIQRRMRPQISKLIKNIYPDLRDHDDTRALPSVVGIRQNVFWLDHNNFQDGGDAENHNKVSHSNQWEVEMTAALVRHIVRQGKYASNEIAVLTPYSGQLQKLRKYMRNDFEIVLSERDEEKLVKDGFLLSDPDQNIERSHGFDGTLEKKKLSDLLRIATVDNFQGEEAKIVIVSLVRSNKDNKVGFLKTTNRINVLLSRAQHGLYLIGNRQTYTSVPMWGMVLGILEQENSLGTSLGLCCPRHPETDLQAFEPEDFARLSPEGGCQLACERRLSDYGHRCMARCHSESMHQIFKCSQRCERLHKLCGHSCQKATCGEDCGNCLILLDDIQLPCGHSMDNVPCHHTQNLAMIHCPVIVEKLVPDCGHTIKTPCSKDVTDLYFLCPTPCGDSLTCGHACTSTCGKCTRKMVSDVPDYQKNTVGMDDLRRLVGRSNTHSSQLTTFGLSSSRSNSGRGMVSGGLNRGEDRRITKHHPPCTRVCNRPYGTCNHSCKQLCHDGRECSLCMARCEVQCAHSKCTLKCYEPCAPCVERCTWGCEHQGRCNMPCAAACDRLPCNRRCSMQLSCGHQCPSICGEPCPEGYCQICSTRQEDRVDLLEMKTYQEIVLDETPIVVLACKHFFTAETLDGMVGMPEVYEQDSLGDFTAIINTSAVLASSVPRCPDCKCPLRQYATPRYNRVINRAVIDEMSKRFLVSGQTELRGLESKIDELEKDLENLRSTILVSIKRVSAATKDSIVKSLKDGQDKSKRLQNSAENFCRKVAEKHEPATKLHDATINALRKRPIEDTVSELSLDKMARTMSIHGTPRDRRITLGACGVKLKIQYIILANKFPLATSLKSVSEASIQIPGGAPDALAKPFFQSCFEHIKSCKAEHLPKLAVEGILYYAKIARLYESYVGLAARADATGSLSYVQKAKELLKIAEGLCAERFQNVELLLVAVKESVKFLEKEWYEEVTKEELDAIKDAMVSGSGGIATHSGHWYNCVNGHPFAIGECGMPMELARCPECGAPIGGQQHDAVEGVTRATSME